MKHILSSFRVLIVMTLILGCVYPLMVSGIAQVFFPKESQGSLIYEKGQLVGSELIGQKFERSEYFWGRPSAIDYNPLPSGGSNLGPTSEVLKKTLLERTEKIKKAHPESGEPPQQLLFASASGLDPHLSVDAIHYQIRRVATARSMSLSQLQQLIASHTEYRKFGLLGEEYVNVLALNRALDKVAPLQLTQPSDSAGK